MLVGDVRRGCVFRKVKEGVGAVVIFYILSRCYFI